MTNWTQQAVAYCNRFPDVMTGRVHQPSPYLSEEASAYRMERLVDRLAKAGPSHPDYARVPASVRSLVDRRMSETTREAA